MATREASDRHQKERPLDHDRTVDSPDASSDGGGTSWKNSTISAQSSRDRAVIEEILARDRRGFVSHRSAGDRRSSSVTINARSRPNRGPIVKIAAEIGVSKRIFFRIEVTMPRPRNRSHDALKQRPRPLQLAAIFGSISLFKSMYSLLYSLTFDRLVKKLIEFRGRSLVHRVPPAFRLDSEGIGAGLITNFSLISSNFPLEFRTSTMKNPSKFASIHENWSPIIAEIGLVVRFD